MSTAHFEIRGWHVLATILAFFATIIAVNVTFAIYAVRSFPGEDVPHSYLQGLHYNDTLAQHREQAALGWRATTDLRSGGDGVVLEVVLNARNAEAIDGAALTGELEWPTNAQLDRALTFEAKGGGRYIAHIGALPHGQWRLRAQAQHAGEAFDFESELTWPSR